MINMNNNINLISNNYKIDILIDELKQKPSLYNKLVNSLLFLGDFNKDIVCNLYKEVDNKYESFTKLWCEDNNGNVFVFYITSKQRTDLNIITKLAEEETNYDISLIKKAKLNEDNVDLIKFDQVCNFKFGRLITDNKTYFNIFLKDNICYRVSLIGNEDVIHTNIIIDKLNNLKDVPSFKTATTIFALVFDYCNIEYEEAILKYYKEYECKLTINLEGTKGKKNNVVKKTR